MATTATGVMSSMEVDQAAYHLRCELLGHHEDVSDVYGSPHPVSRLHSDSVNTSSAGMQAQQLLHPSLDMPWPETACI